VSLRIRLALIVGLTFAVVVIGCVVAVRVSASNELRGEIDRFLVQRSNEPPFQFRTNGQPPNGFPGVGNGGFRIGGRQLERPDAIVQVLDADGSTARASDPVLPVSQQDKALAAAPGKPHFSTVSVDGTHYRMLTTHIGVNGGGGALQIARSIEETNDLLDSIDLRLLLIAIGGTIVAAVAAWLIASRIVRPVERLTFATETVAATQDLTSEIPVDRRDELGRLAESFNTMLVALRSSRDQQKRLVVDASHELRTPLTALRTNIDLLRRASTLDEAQYDEVLAEAQLELEELTELVGELVELATDARADEPVQPVDLGELAERVASRYRRRTGRELPIALDAPAVVPAPESAIERAVANLVENACKFTPADRSVEMRVRGSDIEVSDRGPGISAEDRAHVFDRFYRATSARTMPGSGLGLSIVKQIVELHGGAVEVLPRDGGGTVARITLRT
jgi:two-component system sensor histidine kinase MprB